MAEEEVNASITATVVETTEPVFKPPALAETPEELVEEGLPETIETGPATKQIFAVLEPEEKEQTTFYSGEWLDFYNTYILPPKPSEEALPEFEAPKKELIINIETTGALPWESKLICIGVLDPNALEPQAMNFMQEQEEETLNEFIAWLELQPYEILVGYNVGFDYRFLYALMQRYRKTVPQWKGLKLYDLMQQQKQVKAEFVFGYNKEGKLEEWAQYLFGLPPYAPQEQVYKWLKEGNVDEIVNFNTDKLFKSYFLWVVDKLVDGKIPGTEVVTRYSEPTAETETPSILAAYGSQPTTISVNCPVCKQVQEMLKTEKVKTCFVCGAPIANPAL